MEDHLMTAESPYPGEVLLTCSTDGCGRRVVVRPTALVVLDRGDVGARHTGTAGPPGMFLGIGEPGTLAD
jgi:hypothetical protein